MYSYQGWREGSNGVVTLRQPSADVSGGRQQQRRKDAAERRSENGGSSVPPPSRTSIFSTSSSVTIETFPSWLGSMIATIFYVIVMTL